MKRLTIAWCGVIISIILSFIYPEEMEWWLVILLAVAITMTILETLILLKNRKVRK